MSFLMFAVGIVAVVLGVVLIAAGVPVKEFSFGNTLILAGTIAATGGLIVVGLGAVIAQLQRVTDMLGTRPAGRTTRSLEPFEPTGARVGQALGQGPGQIPFPPKSKPSPVQSLQAESPLSEKVAEESTEKADEFDFAPALRNPELTFTDEAEAAPLMPKSSSWAPQFGGRNEFTESPRPAPSSFSPPARPTVTPERDWRSPAAPARPAPQPNYFDAMWPSERVNDPLATKPVPADDKPERIEPNLRETVMRESVLREPAMPKRPEPVAPSPPVSETRAVPILKSGVIDGMGYTLFVDGSIEAELPHGTLRFASIGELREHLDKSA